MIQSQHELVNFAIKKSLKYTIQVCRNPDFENSVHVLFCQICDDIEHISA